MTKQSYEQLLEVLEYCIEQDRTNNGDIGIVTEEKYKKQFQILDELKEKVKNEILLEKLGKVLRVNTDGGILTAKAFEYESYPNIEIYLNGDLITKAEYAKEEIRVLVYSDLETDEPTNIIEID